MHRRPCGGVRLLQLLVCIGNGGPANCCHTRNAQGESEEESASPDSSGVPAIVQTPPRSAAPGRASSFSVGRRIGPCTAAPEPFSRWLTNP
ncbi:hypothetical protein EDB85DRAFT_2004932, partial [Lactarius pseudohatsudake]